MAKPVAYTKTPDDADVLLEMVEPSFTAKAAQTKGLHLEHAGSSQKIDYVLVYERCEEKENEDDDAKEEAKKHEEMRKAFETSLADAGLIIERSESTSAQVSGDLCDSWFTVI